jgi:CoA binding domain
VVRRSEDLEDVVKAEGVAIGVITTPAAYAQDVTDRLVSAGVTSILNFAPVVLSVPKGVSLRQVDLGVELQILSFYEQHADNQRELAEQELEDADPPDFVDPSLANPLIANPALVDPALIEDELDGRALLADHADAPAEPAANGAGNGHGASNGHATRDAAGGGDASEVPATGRG